MKDRKFLVQFILVMLYYACVGGLIGIVIFEYLEHHHYISDDVGSRRR